MLNALLSFRHKKKKTQKEMADELGLSYSFYRSIEYGYRNPSHSFIKQLKKNYPEFDINHLFISLEID